MLSGCSLHDSGSRYLMSILRPLLSPSPLCRSALRALSLLTLRCRALSSAAASTLLDCCLAAQCLSPHHAALVLARSLSSSPASSAACSCASLAARMLLKGAPSTITQLKGTARLQGQWNGPEWSSQGASAFPAPDSAAPASPVLEKPGGEGRKRQEHLEHKRDAALRGRFSRQCRTRKPCSHDSVQLVPGYFQPAEAAGLT